MPRSFYRQLLLEIAMKPSAGPLGAEKSREQVMAEREAKKLAKLQAKGKKSAAEKAVAKPELASVPKLVETSVVPTKPSASEGSKSEAIVHNAKPSSVPVSESVISKVPEKTREEVLAERAAKKQDKKQGGKAKPKTDENKPPTETQPPAPPVQATPTPEKPQEEPAGKSKAQLKAERRQLQEAQRAKKEAASKDVKKEKTEVVKKEVKIVEKSPKKDAQKVKKTAVDSSHRVKLFAHLYAHSSFYSKVLVGVEDVHPAISQLGAQYRSRVVCGSNVRCLALLAALKKVIEDFRSTQTEDVSRTLGAELTRIMTFLNHCRPVAVSMTNAVKHLRAHLTKCSGSEAAVKEDLLDWIDTYRHDQLEKAAEAISISVRQKIADGDVILTYGFSSLIHKILIAAAKQGIKFRVVVVDGRPWLEGKEMLRRLLLAGVPCTYVLVNALSFIMPQVTKILLGAHALLANGYVMSRCGSSQVALLGRAMNVPVLVCCETHKFSERVQTDYFVHNELGNPDELLAGDKNCRISSIPAVTSLSVMYDVTSPDLVSAVVTELAVLPCTSVPVILRIK